MKQYMLLFGFLALLAGGQAQAGLISVNASHTDVEAGDKLTITIKSQTGFAAFDSFFFDLEFDTSLFAFDPASFASSLPTASPLGAFGFGVLQVTEQAFGLNFSLLSDFVMPQTFSAFTLSFDLLALETGSGSFTPARSQFENSLVVDTSAAFGPAVQVNVTSTTVPEPSSLGLLIFAGLLLLGRRRTGGRGLFIRRI